MGLKTAKADAGLSALLESAGFDPTDVRRYMELSARSGTEAFHPLLKWAAAPCGRKRAAMVK